MEYEDVVRDFARRTRRNLKFINDIKSAEEEVFPVTQLVNSLLGLLVFPEEKFAKKIPEIPIIELKDRGWSIPCVAAGYDQASDLKTLIYYLRNAVAHFNVEFKSDDKEITRVCFWNKPPGKPINWKGSIDVKGLKIFVDRFSEVIECLCSQD